MSVNMYIYCTMYIGVFCSKFSTMVHEMIYFPHPYIANSQNILADLHVCMISAHTCTYMYAILITHLASRENFRVMVEPNSTPTVFELLEESCVQMMGYSASMRRQETGSPVKLSHRQLYHNMLWSEFV